MALSPRRNSHRGSVGRAAGDHTAHGPPHVPQCAAPHRVSRETSNHLHDPGNGSVPSSVHPRGAVITRAAPLSTAPLATRSSPPGVLPPVARLLRAQPFRVKRIIGGTSHASKGIVPARDRTTRLLSAPLIRECREQLSKAPLTQPSFVTATISASSGTSSFT